MQSRNSHKSATTPSLRFIREDLKSMNAYAVQDSNGMIKLDAMENPFKLTEQLQIELGALLGKAAINRYPDVKIQELKQALSDYVDLPTSYQLMLGNGSDELISLLATACLSPKSTDRHTILTPLPSFVMYQMSAQFLDLDFLGVHLKANFELDEEAMLNAINHRQPAITYLAYPNNPTGNLWSSSAIKKIIAACREYGGLVVMDEAYQPFSSHTWLDEMRQSPHQNSHVLLMRTLSKWGLAGVRIGYLLGHTALIEQIDKLRPPYNVSNLNAQCALFALAQGSFFAEQAKVIRLERQRLFDHFSNMPSVTVFPSEGNMYLLRVANSDDLFAKLKSKGILVKNVSKMHPLLANILRITVGSREENDLLIKALAAI